MNNQSQYIGPKTPSTIDPKPQTKPEPMNDWQERYECFLLQNAKRSTYRRYARALDRFLNMNRDKEFAYQFLRPTIIDFVQSRLAEGAAVSTVRLEMAAIRGLFDFMIAMGAYDLMLNPAKNVKVNAAILASKNVRPDHTASESFA